jgi:hypothetical protein
MRLFVEFGSNVYIIFKIRFDVSKNQEDCKNIIDAMIRSKYKVRALRFDVSKK